MVGDRFDEIVTGCVSDARVPIVKKLPVFRALKTHVVVHIRQIYNKALKNVVQTGIFCRANGT